ncbi:putative pdi related protein a protein [Venturia nashicola]|uniref:protein disulfide-isomerase n=1 Tax=Venturia nashicola TaxID=86259 RepID=A0A4Z1P059_9PEZI|nr:putative pdi related protein a protein [Venturia nashicola]
MVSSSTLAVSAASLLFSLPVNAGLYTKNSAVLQVTSKNYDSLITKSNHTSIVEFYAPWCGHCQNLKPAYEKAAKNLAGLAKVAAVDCDDEDNKPFCGRMGVQGFPTLKIVRPGSKPGKPVVEDYKGARAAKAIVDAVVDNIPNHVKKVDDKGLDSWLSAGNDTAKAILFTDKGTTSALLRALAIDFLGSVSVAQIRSKEKNAVETFGITKFPTLVILPGGDKDGVVYDGELKKDAMVAFVKEASGASPNPDPAPTQPKKKAAKAKDAPKSKQDTKKDSKKDSKDGECPMGHKKKDKKASATMKLKSSSLKLEDTNESAEKVDQPSNVKLEDKLVTLLELEKAEELQKTCLAPKSHICVLALLPTKENKDDPLPKEAIQALGSLGHVQQKHARRKAIFPFYAVPAENELGQKVRDTLKLKPANEIDVIAVNSKRSWYRRFPGPSFSNGDVETWVDAIRMNDGPRETLPESLVVEVETPAAEPVKAAEPPKAEQQPLVVEDLGEVVDEEPPKPEAPHDEL